MLKGLKKQVKRVLRAARYAPLKRTVINAHHDVSTFDRSKVFDARKYGFNLTESRCYCLTEDNWQDYITTWESYQPRLGNAKYSLISDDKLLFSQVLGNVVEVPHNYAMVVEGIVEPCGEDEISNETLYTFLVERNGGVLKPRCGYDGYGIHVYTTDGESLLEHGKKVTKAEFDSFVSQLPESLVQNRMQQGAFENRIFDRAVNTVRIISIKKKHSHEHEIVAAVHRFGTSRSAPVDNFAQGGGSALIDLETGRLSAMTCVDSISETGERQFFDVHPDTGAQIRGEVVPHWDRIKDAVITATRKCPYFNYIAWDVVVTDEGIAVIEMNMKSTLNVFQVHGGMRNALLGQKYREYGYITDKR